MNIDVVDLKPKTIEERAALIAEGMTEAEARMAAHRAAKKAEDERYEQRCETITAGEVRKWRREIERKIAGMLGDFTRATGACVTKIQVGEYQRDPYVQPVVVEVSIGRGREGYSYEITKT